MSKPTLSWECASCGKSTSKNRVKLFAEETSCPFCGFDNIKRWETPPRGRKRTGKKSRTIRLKPRTWELILQRKKVSPKGVSLSEIVEFCVNQVLGKGADQSALERVHTWQCLLTQDKRALTEQEEELLEQVYALYENRLPIEPEVWEESTVGELFAILHLAKEHHHIHLPIADEYSQVFCGLLCIRDGFPSLWAYTLFLLFQQEQETVTFERLLSYFSEGLPTYQSNQFAYKFQKIYLSSEESLINYTHMPQYWPTK